VRSLLAAHDRSGGFFGPDAAGRPEPPAPGTLVGVYRLVEKIGEGGMGEVYRAERADGLFGREVALKVTRAGCSILAPRRGSPPSGKFSPRCSIRTS
jgi:eukaryotic-like serine/threonine-protein kinase